MDKERVTINTDSIHITDSYEIPKREFDDYLDYVETASPDNIVIKERSRFSLKMEWVSHNALYGMNIERERTKDVDLEYPQEWYITVGYVIFGMLSYLFVK